MYSRSVNNCVNNLYLEGRLNQKTPSFKGITTPLVQDTFIKKATPLATGLVVITTSYFVNIW